MTEELPLDDIELELLVIMLAQLDALFEPKNCGRDFTADQARWQRRDKYLGRYDWPLPGLLPWSNPGEEGAEKKRWSRAMNTVERLDFVSSSGKEAGLTELGLVAARSFCGRIQLADCLTGLDFILRLLGTDAEWLDVGSQGIITQGYVSECSLAGFDPMPPGEVGKRRLPDSTDWVTDALIPLAEADLIDHAFQPNFELPLYHLTEKGRALAEERRRTGAADPDAWLTLPKDKAIETDTPDAYYTAWERAMNDLKNARPLQANRLKHRLGGCLWPASVLDAKGKKAHRAAIASRNKTAENET